jgi:hypothetical protein
MPRRKVRAASSICVATALVATPLIVGEMSVGAHAAAPTPPLPATPPPSTRPGSSQGAIIAGQQALDLHNTIDSARRILAANYQYYTIDNSGTEPVLIIYVTGGVPSPSSNAFLGSLSSYIRAHTVLKSVKYTFAQLEAFENTLAGYMQANFHSPGNTPTSNFMISIDELDNAVELTIDHADAKFLAQLQPLIPYDALRVQWDDSLPPAPTPGSAPSSHSASIATAGVVDSTRPSPQSLLGSLGLLQPLAGLVPSTTGPGWVSNVSRNTFPPYKGGLYILDGSMNNGAGEWCTSGFTLEINGSYKGVTAGHCTSSSANDGITMASNASDFVGNVDGVRCQGYCGDYSVIDLANQKSYKGTYIATTSGTSAYIDAVVGREASQGFGLYVCGSGATTNAVACGSVTTVLPITTFQGVGNQVCADFNAQQGDSGGPVYVPVPGRAGLAAGVISSHAGISQPATRRLTTSCKR